MFVTANKSTAFSLGSFSSSMNSIVTINYTINTSIKFDCPINISYPKLPLTWYVKRAIYESRLVGPLNNNKFKVLFVIIAGNWPWIVKFTVLILSMLPANTNQMTETFPVQYFFFMFLCASILVMVAR